MKASQLKCGCFLKLQGQTHENSCPWGTRGVRKNPATIALHVSLVAAALHMLTSTRSASVSVIHTRRAAASLCPQPLPPSTLCDSPLLSYPVANSHAPPACFVAQAEYRCCQHFPPERVEPDIRWCSQSSGTSRRNRRGLRTCQLLKSNHTRHMVATSSSASFAKHAP